MPSRKQRRRELKAKRHDYEFVYVDADGNELDEAPPELLEREQKKERANGAKPAGSKQPAKSKSGRPMRVPPQPSWNRALKRSAMLGAVVFALFALSSGKSNNRYLAGLIPAAVYTVLFIPFTYYIDRFAYNRYKAREAAGGSTKKTKS